MSDESLRTVRFHVDRGRHGYRNRAIGLYVAALAVVGITAAFTGADFYMQGPMVLAGMLALAGAGFHFWYWRLDWRRHPVLVALETNPDEVVRAEVVVPTRKEARLDERQVTISTKAAWLLISVNITDLEGLGDALRNHCTNVVLTGFPDE